MAETKEIAFKWGGKREGAGRKAGIKTQARRWEEENPNAYAELMDILMSVSRGTETRKCPHCKGEIVIPKPVDIEGIKYIIDRIKGRPKATIGIAEDDKELLKASTYIEFCKLMKPNLLEEGKDGQEGTDTIEGEALQG